MTIVEVNKKVEMLLSKEEEKSAVLSEEKRINSFLDNINYFKKQLVERAAKYRDLEELFASLTWFDKITKAQEEKVKALINRALGLHRSSLIGYVHLKTGFGKLKVNKAEMKDFKSALDDFEDTLFEVNEILFDLRKDKEFVKLLSEVR